MCKRFSLTLAGLCVNVFRMVSVLNELSFGKEV
jgi:hypothetical protein